MIFVELRKPIMPQAAPSKLCSLADLARRVPDGCALGLGGVFLHRGPFALVRELARQRRRNLEYKCILELYHLLHSFHINACRKQE